MATKAYGTELLTKTAIDTAASSAVTDGELVAAVTGCKIRVAYVFAMSDTAIDLTFETGGDTAVFALFPGANGSASVRTVEGAYLFETVAGENLSYTTDTAAKHTVHVVYSVEK